jgi:hypothetical protein
MSQDEGTAGNLESEVRSVLELVRGNAVQLLAALPHPPSALRIHAGGVVVEAEWAAATPQPTNGGATVPINGAIGGAAQESLAPSGTPCGLRPLASSTAPLNRGRSRSPTSGTA